MALCLAFPRDTYRIHPCSPLPETPVHSRHHSGPTVASPSKSRAVPAPSPWRRRQTCPCPAPAVLRTPSRRLGAFQTLGAPLNDCSPFDIGRSCSIFPPCLALGTPPPPPPIVSPCFAKGMRPCQCLELRMPRAKIAYSRPSRPIPDHDIAHLCLRMTPSNSLTSPGPAPLPSASTSPTSLEYPPQCPPTHTWPRPPYPHTRASAPPAAAHPPTPSRAAPRADPR